MSQDINCVSYTLEKKCKLWKYFIFFFFLNILKSSYSVQVVSKNKNLKGA